MNYTDPETYINDISFEAAKAAHSGTSFVPDDRAHSARKGYAEDLAATYKSLADRCDEHKRALLDEMWPRYRDTYRRLALGYLHSRSGIMSTMITGPSNFPARRMRKRNDAAQRKLNDWIETSARMKRRITRQLWPEKTGIRSGDSDAVQQLEAKLDAMEKKRAWMKECNAALRKALKTTEPVKTLAAFLTEKGAKQPDQTAAVLLAPDAIGRRGFPDYELTNLGARIREATRRLETLRAAKAKPTTSEEGSNGIRIEHDAAAHRVRIYFPGKPDRPTITGLKANGFRWTPSLGAWQAYPNHNTLVYAKAFVTA